MLTWLKSPHCKKKWYRKHRNNWKGGVKGIVAMPNKLFNIQFGELKFPCILHVLLACFWYNEITHVFKSHYYMCFVYGLYVKHHQATWKGKGPLYSIVFLFLSNHVWRVLLFENLIASNCYMGLNILFCQFLPCLCDVFFWNWL